MEALNISNSSVPGTAGVNYCLVFFLGEKFWDRDCETLIKTSTFSMAFKIQKKSIFFTYHLFMIIGYLTCFVKTLIKRGISVSLHIS